MSDWQPRLLQAGEEPAFLDLLTQAFGAWPKVETPASALDHLRWKLEGGLSGGSYQTAVVEDGGRHGRRIVGGIVMLLRDVFVQGRLVPATSGADVAVLPSYRQRGVLSAIAQFTLRHFAPTHQLSFAYFGRHPAVARVAEQAERGMFGNAPDILVADTNASSSPRDDAFVIRRVDRFDERANALSYRASSSFDFIGARSHDYLNWRYAGARTGVFDIFVAEQDASLLGYAVTRVSHGTASIADVLVLPGRDDVVASLIDAALRHLHDAGVSSVECCCPAQHPYRDALMAAGFTRTRTVQRFMYASYHRPDAFDFLRQPGSRVHLSLGDTDLV